MKITTTIVSILLLSGILSSCTTVLNGQKKKCIPPEFSRHNWSASGFCDVWKGKSRIRTRARIEMNGTEMSFALLDEFGMPLAAVNASPEGYSVRRAFPPLNKKIILQAAEGLYAFGLISLLSKPVSARPVSPSVELTRNSCFTLYNSDKLDSAKIMSLRHSSSLYNLDAGCILVKGSRDTVFSFTPSD
ncbi:MAG: hypothetical protein ACOC4C_05580 [Fibrobacterota bacterium]